MASGGATKLDWHKSVTFDSGAFGHESISLEPGSLAGLKPASSILREYHGDLFVSKQSLRRAEAIACARLKRQEANQNLGFASRPFVLCGLPVKKPKTGQLLHERRNGQFLLQVTGYPAYGLPWGQDRLVPIFLATLAIKQQSRVIRFPERRANAGYL